MFSQGRQFLIWICLSAQNCGHRIDSLPDPLFQQGKEDLFLTLKIGVESAARIAGPGGDVFQACSFEPVAGKDSLGARQQLLPRRRRSLSLPGGDPCLRGHAYPSLAFALSRQLKSSHNCSVYPCTRITLLDIIHTCMYLTWRHPAAQALFAVRRRVCPVSACWLEPKPRPLPISLAESSESACDTNGFVTCLWRC